MFQLLYHECLNFDTCVMNYSASAFRIDYLECACNEFMKYYVEIYVGLFWQ